MLAKVVPRIVDLFVVCGFRCGTSTVFLTCCTVSFFGGKIVLDDEVWSAVGFPLFVISLHVRFLLTVEKAGAVAFSLLLPLL